MFEIIKQNTSVLKDSENYQEMLTRIEKSLPAIREGCSQFGKHQSQFMDNFLTVSHPTNLRNARQILAEMNKSIEALKEAQYKINKRKISIKRFEEKLSDQNISEIDREEIELDKAFELSQIDSTMLAVKGAIRSITNYEQQLKNVLAKAGFDRVTEEAFEAEEERYHIMKAFDQAVCAARARNGLIDEGNHIYFSQIGVNGKMAEMYIHRFFKLELEDINKGEKPGHEFLMAFLEHMAEEFKGCSKRVAEIKGIAPITKEALLRAI